MPRSYLQSDSILNQADTSPKVIIPSKGQMSDALQFAFDLLPHLVWVTGVSTHYANSALKQYIGVENHHISETEWMKFIHPKDAEHIYHLWTHAQKTGKKFEKECRIKNYHTGEYEWFLLLAQSMQSNIADFNWMISCTNIHERAVLLRETSDMLRAHTDMLDVSVDCIKIVRPNGTVSHMNRSGCLALLGREREKKFGMKWLDLLPPEVRSKGQKAINDAIKGKNSRFAGMSGIGEGRQYWDNILTPVVNENGETTSILCVSRDVTLQKIAENKLRISSEMDELTGLMNRRSFKKALKASIMQSREVKKIVGMILVDLDHFKHINDTLGHSAGDHLLKVLSKRLMNCLEDNAYVARLGGDEFAIIISNMTDAEEMHQVASKVLEQLDAPVTYQGKLINSGMSMGGAIYPTDAKDALGLMKCADTALNDLKDRGRGGFRRFSYEMYEISALRIQQLDTAREILRSNLIEPYYQPKVRLDTRELIGFEALLRWHDAEGVVQLPSTIVEAFNDYELASKITETMQTRIFQDIAMWLEQGIDTVPISINASPVEFMRDNYAEKLLKRLSTYNIPHELVEIEITEHMLAERGYEYVIRALKKMKNAGVRIALDDFGTGHSSFTHLSDYPVDCLKIDCGFVNRMNEEKPINAIVEGIAKLGPILSLDIIAEGIETDLQLQRLQAVGCNMGQGFLFSRAICADEAICMMQNHAPI